MATQQVIKIQTHKKIQTHASGEAIHITHFFYILATFATDPHHEEL